jgi:rhamnosyltransferase subunit B
MKVLFAPFGSEGDVNPLVAMAASLALRGHEIHFLASPYFEDRIRAAGFSFTPVGTREDYLRMAGNPVLWKPFRGSALVARTMLETLAEYEPIFASALPADLVVTSSFGLAASFGAEARSIPRIMVHMQPACLRSVYDFPLGLQGMEWIKASPPFFRRALFTLLDGTLNAMLLPRLNRHRARMGLKPLRNFYHDALFSAEGICLPAPEWFAPPQPDWPATIKQTPFPRLPTDQTAGLPFSIDSFLSCGEAPIVWTHGSANFGTDRFEACAVEVTRRLGLRGVIVSPQPSSIALPETMLAVGHVRFDVLFPRCRAVVHHGGIGTTAQAFAAGIPQLIIPLSHDQPDNAWRVERLGVGSRLPLSGLKPARVAAKLKDLLSSPLVASKCAYYADLMADTSRHDDCAQWMEEVVGGYNPAAISSRA